MPDNQNTETTIVKGIIEDIVFKNDDNGYAICIIDCDGEPVTITGIMPGIS